MNSVKLYERIALARDIEDHDLRRGDVATLVDRVPHPHGGADGLVLEVFNALEDSLQVVVVAAEDVESLHAKEVFAVRELA